MGEMCQDSMLSGNTITYVCVSQYKGLNRADQRVIMSVSDPSDIMGDGTLFIGNAACAEEHGASFYMIVNCAMGIPFSVGPTLCVHVPIEDGPFGSVCLFQIMRDSTVLEDMHGAITDRKKVLVHCATGEQHSPAVVACYLVKYNGMTPLAAITFIRTRRRAAFFWTVDLRQAIQLYHSHQEFFSNRQLPVVSKYM